MTDEDPSGTYSVHLTGELAAEIENDVDERGVSKSKALRDLLVDGKQHRDRSYQYFEIAFAAMTGVALAATLALLVALAAIALAAALGAVTGVNPWLVLVAVGVTATVALLGFAFRLLDVGEHVDDAVAALDERLGL